MRIWREEKNIVVSIQEPWYSRIKPVIKYSDIFGIILGFIGVVAPVIELLTIAFGILALVNLVKIRKIELSDNLELAENLEVEEI